MSVAQIVLSIIVVVASLFLIVVVLFQSGKSSGLSGAFGGSFETYMSKNKGSSLDARLARLTKWIGLVFVLAVLVLNFV
jgi:preprotein translocase subunit SecG